MPTLKQLTSEVAQRTSLQKTQIDRIFEVLTEEMAQTMMRGEEFRWPAIGTLKVKTLPPTTGRNPRTGVALDIDERRRVKFTTSKTLLDRLNPPEAVAKARRRA